jgi:hypothetical protein
MDGPFVMLLVPLVRLKSEHWLKIPGDATTKFSGFQLNLADLDFRSDIH